LRTACDVASVALSALHPLFADENVARAFAPRACSEQPVSTEVGVAGRERHPNVATSLRWRRFSVSGGGAHGVDVSPRGDAQPVLRPATSALPGVSHAAAPSRRRQRNATAPPR
jgi:hypothetical protein